MQKFRKRLSNLMRAMTGDYDSPSAQADACLIIIEESRGDENNHLMGFLVSNYSLLPDCDGQTPPGNGVSGARHHAIIREKYAILSAFISRILSNNFSSYQVGVEVREFLGGFEESVRKVLLSEILASDLVPYARFPEQLFKPIPTDVPHTADLIESLAMIERIFRSKKLSDEEAVAGLTRILARQKEESDQYATLHYLIASYKERYDHQIDELNARVEELEEKLRSRRIFVTARRGSILEQTFAEFGIPRTFLRKNDKPS